MAKVILIPASCTFRQTATRLEPLGLYGLISRISQGRPNLAVFTAYCIYARHLRHRFIGYGRGRAYEPTEGQTPTEPIGTIPQVASTFAFFDSNYGVMNERQLAFGESTCSGRFAAKGAKQGGDALFCVNELSRVAMERCDTARCAIQLMGDLAVQFGFYGASSGFEGSSERCSLNKTAIIVYFQQNKFRLNAQPARR